MQVGQLKNIIKKLTATSEDVGERGHSGKKKKKERTFDPSLYKKRHVLLRVAYFGWDYHGFAVQENTGERKREFIIAKFKIRQSSRLGVLLLT